MSMAHPHYLTVTEFDGERSVDWTHPADCPDGERCDIRRRARRMRSEVFWELVEGRPVGAYRLGRFGFHGLLLVDGKGGVLPDVVEALPPTAQAARDVAFDVIRQLAEAICEDTERVVELARIIQHGQAVEQAEDASNRAVNTLIDEHLGTMRAYTGPIDRLLGDAAAESPQPISRPDPAALASHLRALRREAMTPTRGAIERIMESR